MKNAERIGWVLALVAFLGVLYAVRDRGAPEVPAGVEASAAAAPAAPPVQVSFSIWVLGPSDGAFERLRETARQQIPAAIELAAQQAPVAGQVSLRVARLTPDERPPPSATTLKYFGRGIDPALATRLASPTDTLRISLDGPRPRAGQMLFLLSQVVRAVAAEVDGVVWDDETGEAFSPAAFREWRESAFADGLPVVPRHLVIHTYGDGAGVRSVTLGMKRLGLPDLAVEEYERRLAPAAALLVGFVAQRLYEQGGRDPGGAIALDPGGVQNGVFRASLRGLLPPPPGWPVTIPLAPGEPRKGDPDNRLLAIGGTDRAALEQLLSQTFTPRAP